MDKFVGNGWKAAILATAAVLAFSACGEEGGDAGDGGCSTDPVELESGVQYEEIECGDGAEAKTGDTLIVHYTGTFEDGTEFDSSVGGDPLPFVLGSGDVIQGWDLGLEGMKVGGKRKLTIPPDYAYGPAGGPGIPPDSTLIFEVELVDIEPAP